MRLNIKKCVLFTITIALLAAIVFEGYSLARDYIAYMPYNVPKDGVKNYILNDIKQNNGEWKMIIDNRSVEDGYFEIDDLETLLAAKDEFYVIEDRNAYYESARCEIILYRNEQVKKHVLVNNINKIFSGSLKKYILL